MNENKEVGNTEHDPPPQDSSFTDELIREDISNSVDEPKEPNCSSDVGHSARADNILESSLPAFDNWPEDFLEHIREDISESVDEPKEPNCSSDVGHNARADNILESSLQDFLEAILAKSESYDEPEGLNWFSDVASDVGHSARADNNQESSLPAFQNWQGNSSIKIRSRHRAGTDFSTVNPTYPQSIAPRRMRLQKFQCGPLDQEIVPSDFKEFVTVRAKAVNDNDDETEYIHKEEAICRVCNAYVLEEINLLKTKCKCKCKRNLTLLHEKCTLEWSTKEENKICHTCEELIHYVPVTLSRASTPEISKKPSFGKRADNNQESSLTLIKSRPYPEPQSTARSDFKEFVTVRAKAVNDNDDGTEYVHKEEAICRVCNAYVLEEINLLKTKCKCNLTLLHEKCTLEWFTRGENKICHICEELIHYVPVALSRTSTQEIPQKPSSGKRFLKLFSWFFGGVTG